MTIAGHTFIDSPTGRACACGRLWVQIAGTRHDDIGKPHIAHIGDLNVAEFEQIEAERERIWSTVFATVAA